MTGKDRTRPVDTSKDAPPAQAAGKISPYVEINLMAAAYDALVQLDEAAQDRAMTWLDSPCAPDATTERRRSDD